jgi:hypothetical protein
MTEYATSESGMTSSVMARLRPAGVRGPRRPLPPRGDAHRRRAEGAAATASAMAQSVMAGRPRHPPQWPHQRWLGDRVGDDHISDGWATASAMATSAMPRRRRRRWPHQRWLGDRDGDDHSNGSATASAKADTRPYRSPARAKEAISPPSTGSASAPSPPLIVPDPAARDHGGQVGRLGLLQSIRYLTAADPPHEDRGTGRPLPRRLSADEAGSAWGPRTLERHRGFGGMVDE